MSEPRTIRSKLKRYLIAQAQEFKCAICGCDISDGCELDHIVPYSKGGKTNSGNSQATCRLCNLKKGNRMWLMKKDEHDTRPEVLRAIQHNVNAYTEGKQTSCIVLPPRFGKSTVIRGTALELQARGAPPSIMLAPWEMLVDQIITEKDILRMMGQYCVPRERGFVASRIKSIKSKTWWKFERRPTLMSMTMGLAHRNEPQFLDGIEDLVHAYGKRVALLVDEAQLCREQQSWGELAQSAIERGAFVVTLSGTPIASMFGVNKDAGEWTDTSKTIHKRYEEDGKHYLSVKEYEGQTRTLENIKGDVHVTMSDAWSRGCLAQCNAVWADVMVKSDKTGETIGQLSQIEKTDLNGQFRRIIESDEMVSKMSEACVERLAQWRTRGPKGKSTKALVITGFDVESDVQTGDTHNRHAKSFKKWIEAHANDYPSLGRLRIEIVTGVNDDGEPNDQAKDTIKRFRETNDIDILIVKMMGIVGLDVPTLKVGVYAGMPRKGPMTVQALTRTMTVWDAMRQYPCDIIMPKDKDMVTAWTEMVESKGGEFRETKLDLISEELEEIDELPPEELDLILAEEAFVSGYHNHMNDTYDGDHEKTLALIKSKYIVRGITDVEILENYRRGAFPVDDVKVQQPAFEVHQVVNLSDELATVESFGKKARAIVNKYLRYKADPDKYSDKISHLQSEAKKICNIKEAPKQINDPDKLQRLINALPEAERRVFGRG